MTKYEWTVSRIERERKTTIFKALFSRKVIRWHDTSFPIVHNFFTEDRGPTTRQCLELEEVVVVVDDEELYGDSLDRLFKCAIVIDSIVFSR